MDRRDLDILVEELICLRDQYKDVMSRHDCDIIASACNVIDRMNKFHDFSNENSERPNENENVLVKLDTGYFDVATHLPYNLWVLASSGRIVDDSRIKSWRSLKI